MKKSLLLLSIPALLMAASCSSDEVIDAPALKDNAITFSPVLQNCSRGNSQDIEMHTPESFKEFFVSAFSSDPGHNTENFFFDHRVSKNAAGSWSPSGDNYFYFPEWRLKFIAYAPGGSYELSGMTSPGQGTRYRFYTDITPQKQAITNVQLAFYNNLDLIVAANGKRDLRHDPKVKMTFKHALSKVTIKVKQMNPALRFEVSGAGIGNALNRGTFTYPDCTDKEEIEVTQSCWTFPDGFRGNFSTNSSETLLVDGNNRLSTVGECLVFPVNTTNNGYWTRGPEPDGAYLYVTCRIMQKSSKDAYETELVHRTTVAVPLKFDFQPGYHYTFNVDITNGGLIAPGDQTPNGGTPVLNGTIEYEASSSLWELADTSTRM